MDTNADITAAVFAAYLQCPTKAYLTAYEEGSPDTFFADLRGRVSAACKVKASRSFSTQPTGGMPIDFMRLAGVPDLGAATLFVDCETTSYACHQLASPRVDRRAKRAEYGHDYIPVLYCCLEQE